MDLVDRNTLLFVLFFKALTRRFSLSTVASRGWRVGGYGEIPYCGEVYFVE